VEAAKAVGEARPEIIGDLTPERVVPAELTAAQDVVPIELVEIVADPVDGPHGATDVSRDMVGDTRPHAARADDALELLDGEGTVGESRMGVTVRQQWRTREERGTRDSFYDDDNCTRGFSRLTLRLDYRGKEWIGGVARRGGGFRGLGRGPRGLDDADAARGHTHDGARRVG